MIGCRARFASPFMQFGQPDPRHEVQLIDRQGPFQRRSFGIVISRDAVRLGKVHPQRRFAWCASGCGGQMFDRLVDLASIERVQPEIIEAERVGSGQGLSAQ
jgi:hypothetical protein